MTVEYREKLEDALKYQDFVKHELYKRGIPIVFNDSRHYQYTEGENILGIEIKNDKRFRDTGNLYIETAEKTNASNESFVPSGICREDNSWLYLIGDYQTIYIFGINTLNWMHRKNKYERRETETSQGFLLPLATAEICAVRIIKIETK